MPGRIDEDQYILDWAMERYRESRDEHVRSRCEDWLAFHELMRNWVDPRPDPDDYHSNIGGGLVFPIVKSLSAQLMTPWEAGDRIWDCEARSAIGINIAPMIGANVNDYAINRIPRMFSKMELAKESALVFSRGILKHIVKRRPKRSRLKRVMMQVAQQLIPNGLNFPMVRMQEEQPTEFQTFDYVDPFNWWWVGESRWYDPEKIDFTVEQLFLSTQQVWREIEAGNFNEVDVERGSGLGYDDYTERRLDARFIDIHRVRTPGRDNPHRIIEFQGWVELPGTMDGGRPRQEQRIVQILDERAVVKNKPLETWDGNPGYVCFEPIHDPGQSESITLIDIIEPLVYAHNDLLNIGLDNARKIIESTLIADPTATDQKEIYLGPGEVNWFRNPTQTVTALQMKDLPRSWYEFIGLTSDLVQRASGVNDHFGGLNTSDTDRLTQTVGGMKTMVQQSMSRFSPVVRKMGLELYRPIAVAIHETSKLFMLDPEEVKLPGNPSSPFAKLNPADLDIPVEFTFNAKALDAALGKRRQEFMEAMGFVLSLAPLLQQQGAVIDGYEAARIVFHEFDRERDAERVVKRLQDIMQQQPGMLGGGAGPGAMLQGPGVPGTAVGPVPSQMPPVPGRAA